MRQFGFAAVSCLALTMCAVLMVSASVVVVDPNNMGSWTTFLKQSVSANASFAFANMAPGNSTIGVGAFYANAGTGAGTSATAGGQVWLGNDQYTGTKLRDITKLQYTTFTWTSGANPSPTGDDYVRQPIQMQLAIQLTPGGDWAYLMHRPWGMIGQGHPLTFFDVWQTWDAMDSNGVWYVAYSESTIGPAMAWPQIVLAHPDAVLATPPIATNWDVPFTGSGCSVNFEVGCRKRGNAIVFGTSNYGTWWKEAEGFRGYVDKFTIEAIDYVTDPLNPVTVIPETTYDFEGAEPMPRTLYMSHRAAWETPISLNRDENYMFNKGFVRLFGKVSSVGWDGTGKTFRLDDGTGRPILVMASDSTPAFPDNYVIATGTLKQVQWQNENPPIVDRFLTCRSENVFLVFGP